MSKNAKSAKDLAFEKERVRLRREYNTQIAELQKKVSEKDAELSQIKIRLAETESLLQEKEEWIERLLEYTDLPKEEIKELFEKEKSRADLAEKMGVLFGMVDGIARHY